MFRPDSRWFLLAVFSLHGYFLLVMGVVLGVDASSYIRITDALQHLGSVPGIIEGETLWWHNYVSLGLPFAWKFLALLPVGLIWPVWALMQHLVAALSLVFLLRRLYRLWPTPAFGVAGLLICALPFYQSMHNAFLTESVSSSMFLLAAGLAFSAVGRQRWDATHTLAMVACVFLAAQFRGALAIFSLLAGLSALFYLGQLFSRHSAALVVACAAGILLFPALRVVYGGEYIEPRLGPSRLWGALRANPSPSAAVLDEFRHYRWPDNAGAEKLLSEGASFAEITSVLDYWVRGGASNLEVIQRSEALGSVLMADGHVPRLHAVLYGFSASGFNLPLLALPEDHTVLRGYNGDRYYHLIMAYYRYFSWLDPKRKVFESYLTDFFEKEGMSALHRLFARAWRPYFRDRLPQVFRDPLLLGRVPPDVWFLLGVLSYLVVIRRLPFVALLMLSIVAVNVYVTGSALFPNIRYSYPLMPLFLLGPAFLVAARRVEPVQITDWFVSRCLENCRAISLRRRADARPG